MNEWCITISLYLFYEKFICTLGDPFISFDVSNVYICLFYNNHPIIITKSRIYVETFIIKDGNATKFCS